MMYFPEYKHSMNVNEFRVLDRTAADTFQFPANANAGGNARLHFTPLWFPNGVYRCQAYVADVWTPAGMLSKYYNSSSITIKDSAYDDWYVSDKKAPVTPALNCDFNIADTNPHISKNIVVTMDTAANVGDKAVSWSLTKNGSAASYTGSLGNYGGSIKVSETGAYTLTATITDSPGKTSTCSKSISVYNNAPSAPVITRTPNGSPENSDDFIRITALSTDPDGDRITYVWENRPNNEVKYAPGR